MTLYRSEPLQFVVWGPFGCFTRAEFRSDPVSWGIATVPAAIGISRSIYWHPEAKIRDGEKSRVEIDILAIKLLAPIKTMRMRVTELEDLPNGKSQGDKYRMTSILLLKDPMYMFDISYVSQTSQKLVIKAAEIFKRRLAHGQCHSQPCLGRRRYPAFVREVTDDDKPIAHDEDFGRLPWGIEYREDEKHPQVLHTLPDAKMRGGVLKVPSFMKMLHEQGSW